MSARQAGAQAFKNHRNCGPFQGYAPAERLEGFVAIRFHLPPEEQALLQMATPHSRGRLEWVAGWEEARAAFLVGDSP